MTRLQITAAFALLSMPTLLFAQAAPVLFPPVNLNPQPNYTVPQPPPPPPPSTSATISGSTTVSPGGIPAPSRDPRIDPEPTPGPPADIPGVVTVTMPLPD